MKCRRQTKKRHLCSGGCTELPDTAPPGQAHPGERRDVDAPERDGRGVQDGDKGGADHRRVGHGDLPSLCVCRRSEPATYPAEEIDDRFTLIGTRRGIGEPGRDRVGFGVLDLLQRPATPAPEVTIPPYGTMVALRPRAWAVCTQAGSGPHQAAAAGESPAADSCASRIPRSVSDSAAGKAARARAVVGAWQTSSRRIVTAAIVPERVRWPYRPGDDRLLL